MNTNRDENNSYFQYLNEISRYPLLTREQERILLKKIAEGSRSALDLLVKSNLRFVVNIANMYKGQGLEVGELINEGNMGLIEAARRFDTSKDLKFISYAVWWVRQNITRAIAEKGRMVRISAEKELILRRFAKKGGKLRQVQGGDFVLDPESLEGISKYNAKAIEKILMMNAKVASFSAPVTSDSKTTLEDCLPSTSATADAMTLEKDRKAAFDRLFKEHLSIQEEEIIKNYFGINVETEMCLKDVAPRVGLSKERVRQLKESALQKLKASHIKQIIDAA